MAIARKPARLIFLDTGQSIPLTTPPMVVGRPDPALAIKPDIVLNDKTVGRRHAVIDDKEGYTIEDLNSMNKTKVNGVILTPKQQYALHDGDSIEFGSVKARFEQ